jgi:hypothetical protein
LSGDVKVGPFDAVLGTAKPGRYYLTVPDGSVILIASDRFGTSMALGASKICR